MIGFLSLDESKITKDSLFLNESFSLEVFSNFRFGQNFRFSSSPFKFDDVFSSLHIGIGTSFGIKSWDSCTTGSDFLC